MHPRIRSSGVFPSLTAIVHAPYGDSVFIVDEKKPGSPGAFQTQDGQTIKIARQSFVRTADTRGDFIAVLEGVKAGDEVVVAGAFKLRNEAPIVINNSVQPKPQMNPQLENH